ncbi:MAG: stage III sporulation protein AB [Oscillospiraceae bacterium]|nr:stage III sporulation protein AB [Oscillospiraceae bacterium]
MKAVGAVLLVCACTLFGIGQAKKLYLRRSCLAGTLDALRFIGAELKNGAVPIPEIFAELRRLPDTVMHGFFETLCSKMDGIGDESLSEIWSGCVMNDRTISLSQRQRQELSRLGPYLGRYSETEQSDAISACAEHLEAELIRSSEKAREGAKLFTGLGLTLGLMLAAVLL